MVWIDLILFFILFALFVYVFVSVTITKLHKVYLAFHFSMMLWPFCQFAIKTTDDPIFQLFYVKAAFVDGAFLSIGWMFFTILLTGQIQFLKKRVLLLLSVPITLASLGLILNPYGWFVQPVDGGYVQRTYGPVFWFYIAVIVIHVIVSLYVITVSLTHSKVPRIKTQIMLVLKGLLSAAIFIMLDVLLNVVLDRFLPVIPGMTSLGILLSAIFFVISIDRDKVFDIITIAHRDVMDTIALGILVIDDNEMVLEINKALLPHTLLRVGDRFSIENILPGGSIRVAEFLQAYRERPLATIEIEVLHPAIKRHLHIQAAPILVSGERVGRIITFQDTSELQRLIEETHNQNMILQERNQALIEVQKKLFQTNRQLKQMAITDSLTGCYNRHYLTQQLEAEVVKNRKLQNPFALILLDIDYFKQVNDTYGHLAGDEVICSTVEIIKRSLRRTDIFARYGGEEFIIYLPHVGESQAHLIAEQIKTSVEANQVIIANNFQPISVTISMGLLTINDFSVESDLLEAVDKALYQAKHEGRNRIVHLKR
ncbi:histidine kinase N-terminal 7TM domain-containing diguanylate cyclase [Paenibacillus sp. BAC0078]